MSNKYIEIVAGILDVKPEDLNAESGPENVPTWDSLAQIAIVTALEETYGFQLTMPEILAIKSIADLKSTLIKRGVNLN